jgi:hypothetical protein
MTDFEMEQFQTNDIVEIKILSDIKNIPTNFMLSKNMTVRDLKRLILKENPKPFYIKDFPFNEQKISKFIEKNGGTEVKIYFN